LVVRVSAKAVYLELILVLKHRRWIFLAGALLALNACSSFGPGLDDDAANEGVNPVRQALASSVSVEDADAAIARKDYDAAYGILRQYLIINPSDDAAKISLARTYLGRHEGLNAQTALNSLTDEAKEEPRVHMLLGLALLVEGKRVEATEQLELALAEDATLWQSANGLALIHDFDQKWDEAEAKYRYALEIKNDSAVVHNNLGYSYLLQGRVDEAVTAFSESLVYEPQLAVARSNLRLALAAKGRYTDAIAGTERAKLPQVLNNIGYVAMLSGDFESADIFLNRAIDESPVYYDTAEENLERLQTLVDKPLGERRLQSIIN
jgi:Flp pilus assembly protein TadD